MQLVLRELNRVTKDDSLIVFVVGDRKRGKNIVNGGQFFSEIWEPSYILEREYKGTASQVFDELNNTKERNKLWYGKK